MAAAVNGSEEKTEQGYLPSLPPGSPCFPRARRVSPCHVYEGLKLHKITRIRSGSPPPPPDELRRCKQNQGGSGSVGYKELLGSSGKGVRAGGWREAVPHGKTISASQILLASYILGWQTGPIP